MVSVFFCLGAEVWEKRLEASESKANDDAAKLIRMDGPRLNDVIGV